MKKHGTKPCSAESRPLSPWENGVYVFSTASTTGSYCAVSQAVVCTEGPCAQAPQPAGPSGQLGKEQNRANAEDLFSRHGVGFGLPNSTPYPGACSVGAELPQEFIGEDGGPTETLSEAPGAYGCSCSNSSARLLHMRPLQHWLNGESQGGYGNAVLTGFRLHRPAAKPSARDQIPRSFGKECPWSRYPDMLWYSRMPQPSTGQPRTTGTQYQGFGRVLQSKNVLVHTDNMAKLRISTGKKVYTSVACRSSPVTSSSGVKSIWGPFVPSTSQECLIGT